LLLLLDGEGTLLFEELSPPEPPSRHSGIEVFLLSIFCLTGRQRDIKLILSRPNFEEKQLLEQQLGRA